MTTERSPRFPAENIAEVLSITEKLYKQAGRTPVTSEVAAKAIGYSGLNGASRTVLASLTGYGTIQRQGDTYKVSDEALRVIRPIGDQDKLTNIRLLAFRPKAFADIRENHGDCSETVLASLLLHKGFTDEGARRAARVYKENVAFLEAEGHNIDTNEQPAQNVAPEPPPLVEAPTSAIQQEATSITTTGKMLAQYSVPLGSNQATLVFTGESLSAEDFDALKDYVDLFKKQFERASKLAVNNQPASPSMPKAHKPEEKPDSIEFDP